MVKSLDGAAESHWVGLSETFILLSVPSRAWLEKLFNLQTFSHFFKTVIKVFIVFQIFTPCLQNEAVNQLKANFIYWKATRVSLDYTHRLAVCAHFERHLPPSLWTLVLQRAGLYDQRFHLIKLSNSKGLCPAELINLEIAFKWW